MHRQEAVRYARQFGWSVFPCIDKVPLTKNGFKDASKDPEIVEKMFEGRANANIGIATGSVSGIWVLDIDIKDGKEGALSLKRLIEQYGDLPQTIESRTWSGGRHIFFRYPQKGIGCKVDIRKHIDVRGDGGYIIAPPSVVSNAPYAWQNGPDSTIAEAPGWLLELSADAPTAVDLSDNTAKIPISKRNSSLTSYAGGFRRAGLDEQQIVILLEDINHKRCEAPLSRREIERIAKSVCKYSPDNGKSGPSRQFNCNAIAKSILEERTLIFCGDNFYLYTGSVYKQIDEYQVRKMIAEKLQNDFKIQRCNEVLHSIKVKVSLPSIDALNGSELLNLRNGMFNTDTLTLTAHNPLDYSTIQLPVEYDKSAACPLWQKTLNDIFPDGKDKIDVLQEYFGLCLTKSVKHEKALFLLGEGRNGKSTVISVLQHILGRDNYSAVTIESLTKPNYCAEIFGKLANISEETSAKTSICDSTFKSLISGNATLSDRKYGHPFMFFPFCKMIYALNNMPQVSDKTDSYFKRVIIINFMRKFEEAEQDRGLKDKLKLEANGIFLWMLEGLKRLTDRGYFKLPAGIEAATDEYRKENNSVLVFVEEECCLSEKNFISKKQLYESYVGWCKDAGMHPLSKKKFGMQLIKHFNLSKNSFSDASNEERIWVGIDLNENFSFTNKKEY